MTITVWNVMLLTNTKASHAGWCNIMFRVSGMSEVCKNDKCDIQLYRW